MQYMLLIHEDESSYAGENGAATLEATLAGHMKLMEELGAAGVAFSGNRLREAATATTIRYENGGEGTLHDGPFAETHEELGGYYIVEAADHDEAVRWARKIPIPGKGAIEIRPVWED
ncbi:YciI family protein [Citromicrobium bathyomarinum]|uniref:YciI family protein n=1 Tax=Citromicrobium bathyomarinum TaxID=72174 RepID=UPI003159EB1D